MNKSIIKRGITQFFLFKFEIFFIVTVLKNPSSKSGHGFVSVLFPQMCGNRIDPKPEA